MGSTAAGAAPITPAAGQTVQLVCLDDTGATVVDRTLVYDPANPLPGLDDPAQAAALAQRRLELPDPAVSLSPPATATQLVGLPTWLWITNWSDLQASATLDGVTATVTAHPTRTTWTTTTGPSTTCDGPGTPYQPTEPADAQHTDCSLLFQRAGTETLAATTTYTVAWTATTGDQAALDPLTRTTATTITVDQAQALIH